METFKYQLLGHFPPASSKEDKVTDDKVIINKSHHLLTLLGEGSYQLPCKVTSFNSHSTLHANPCKIVKGYIHLRDRYGQ